MRINRIALLLLNEIYMDYRRQKVEKELINEDLRK